MMLTHVRKILNLRSTSLIIKIFQCVWSKHCVKSVQIRSFSGPYFPAFGLNTETYALYRISLRIQSECGKCGPEKVRIWTLFTQWKYFSQVINSKNPLDSLVDTLQLSLHKKWITRFFLYYKQHYYEKQHQAQIGKKVT